MNNFSKVIILFLVFCVFEIMYAQNNSIKKKTFLPLESILKIDSLPIDYTNFQILKNNIEINPSLYDLQSAMSTVLLDSTLLNDTIIIKYQILNPNIKISLRDSLLYIPVIEKEPYYINKKPKKDPISELYTNGSFVRNFSNGNNQNLSINTDVDLRISGKINESLFIDGFISDNSLPLQYGESSSSLQELDKIYIKLYNSNISLTGGDIDITNLSNYFLKFSRKSIGIDVNIKNSNTEINSSIGITKNIFKRQNVIVQNGNQGPYKLVGENNEPYILVISNSESVFIDGVKKIRGSDKDYIINYSTGEITFTNKVILNDNNRVIIEFQYTNQNYFKWLAYSGFSKEANNIKYYLNFYTEQDNKNSPINPLNEEELNLLNNAGDNNTYVTSVYEMNYDPNSQQILYFQKDTIDPYSILHESIFVFGNNPSDSLFQVTFSNVGNGNGDYILESSLVNGSVFKWISPINGQPQGNYSPIKILIAPKKNQMITFGGLYEKNNITILLDVGVSNTDQNLFSKIHDQDNIGMGTKFLMKKLFVLNKTHIEPSISYEFINHQFSFIERARELEFDRNWKINNDIGNQKLLNISLNTSFNDNTEFNYSFENMKFNESNKIKNSFKSLIQKNDFIINLKGSLLNSLSQTENINLFQYKNSMDKKGKIGITILNEGEVLKSEISDTRFNKLFIKSSIKNTFIPLLDIEYTNRIDHNELVDENVENSVSITSNLIENKKIKSDFRISYSDFSVYRNDSLIHENSLSTKANYYFHPVSFIKLNGTYEISSGQEAYREIRYVKVNSGYGTYSWIDYNNNNIEEYNEFEISHFSDTADYMKISFPTNNYFNVKNTRINQQLKLSPKTTKTKGLLYKLSFFENLSNVEINRKIMSNNWNEILSPFYNNQSENILSLNLNLNNTLIFQPKNKNIFIAYKIDRKIFKNSFEWDRQLSESFSQNIKLKFIFNEIVSETNLYYTENKLTNENLLNQNYFIKKRGLDLEFLNESPNFTPSFYISIFTKNNIASIEKLNGLKISSRFMFNGKNGLILNSNLTFYKMKYSGELNNAISYQMLDGLSSGNGLKWETSLKRNIKKLVFSLKYSGELNSLNTIHYAQIEFKKYF